MSRATRRAIPGEVFTVALVVHGEEALRAGGFVFTIHFFNGHFRPEKIPIDTVVHRVGPRPRTA